MHAISRTSRRTGSALGALLAVALVGAAEPASAAPAGPALPGTAYASTATIGLDVRLLHGIDVPVDVSLNAVHAPESADEHLLTATVQGMQGGGAPQTLLDAGAGHSSAVVDQQGARAATDLVTAVVRVPGLLAKSVVALDEVRSRADCPAHGKPSAEVDVLGDVSILGTKVTLTAAGPTHVELPGIGMVDVQFSKKTVTSSSAAATALAITVSIDPGKLNVVRVLGTVELGNVHCSMGGSGGGGGIPTGAPTTASDGPATTAPPTAPPTGPAPTATAPGATGPTATAPAVVPAAAVSKLAETGGGSSAPLIGGAALLLVGVGASAVALTRRRRRS
jgi:hypothetical protein